MKALGNVSSSKIDDALMVADCEPFEYSRLAFVHKAYKFLFKCKKKDFIRELQKIPWKDFYKVDFCIRARNLEAKEAELAAIIWNALENPKVNLKHSSMQVEIIGHEDWAYCGILLAENLEKFYFRRPHLRPGFHPSSINPKLARACVNLSRLKKGQTLLDPFCGTGGILAEAAMMGINVIGYDIDPRMLSMAKKNFEFFKFKNYTLAQCDSTTAEMKADALVTDPPYGRSASLHKSEKVDLYEKVLENAYRQMKPGHIFVFIAPSTVKFKTNFKILASIDHFVHSGLTRKIHVLQR